MPVIKCPNCSKKYEVSLNVLEKKVKCKKCGRLFRAAALKAVEKKKTNTFLWPIVGFSAVLVVAIVLIATSGGGGPEEEPLSSETDALDETPASTKNIPSARTDQKAVKTEREKFCIRFLEFQRNADLDALQDSINFPVYHNAAGGDNSLWSDLSDLDQVLKKQEVLDTLTDDTRPDGEFLRHASVRSTKEISFSDRKAEVEILLRNQANGREQKRTFSLVRIGDNWTVGGMKIGPQYGGDLDAVAGDGPKTLDEKYENRISPDKEITEVDFLPETSNTEKEQLIRFARDLIGDERQRSFEARKRLSKLGKPAIPALLNQLIALDFERGEDLSRANRCITVLRQITGRSFGFSPGFQQSEESTGTEEEMNRAIQLWFGWWRRNKETWKERDLKKEMEDW